MVRLRTIEFKTRSQISPKTWVTTQDLYTGCHAKNCVGYDWNIKFTGKGVPYKTQIMVKLWNLSVGPIESGNLTRTKVRLISKNMA